MAFTQENTADPDVSLVLHAVLAEGSAGGGVDAGAVVGWLVVTCCAGGDAAAGGTWGGGLGGEPDCVPGSLGGHCACRVRQNIHTKTKSCGKRV